VRARLLGAVSVACFALVACGGDEGPGTVSLYDRAPVPGVPDRTTAVDSTGLTQDGPYWGELLPADASRPALTFHITQAFFADACAEELGADECPNDFGTLDKPSLDVDAALTDLVVVSVVTDDRVNFAVTADELFSVAAGAPPAAEAPEGFAFVPFPFLLTVRDGKVVEARQIWLP
jgi:hypothetical protein